MGKLCPCGTDSAVVSIKLVSCIAGLCGMTTYTYYGKHSVPCIPISLCGARLWCRLKLMCGIAALPPWPFDCDLSHRHPLSAENDASAWESVLWDT